jgi:hypothetical protein
LNDSCKLWTSFGPTSSVQIHMFKVFHSFVQISLLSTFHRLKIQRQKESWRFKRRRWCHLIDLDSLFQNTPIITHEKTNHSAGRCIWRYSF